MTLDVDYEEYEEAEEALIVRRKPRPPKFRLLTLRDVLEMPDPEWLIEGLMQTGNFVELFGKDKSGKSFLALDWALSIAFGRDWLGRKVKQGPVVYVAAEGFGGFKFRVPAWLKQRSNNVDLSELEARVPIRLIGRGVNMLDGKEVDALINDIGETFSKPNLVVLDTLARNFGTGDENSSRDMGAFVKGGDAVRAAFPGATLLVVHHAAKGGRGERGSSALPGAVEAKMELVREVKKDGTKTSNLTLYCRTQKDAPECSPIYLSLKCGGDGSSCIIEGRDAPKPLALLHGLPSTKEKAFEALAHAPEGLTLTEWQRETGIAKSTLQDARDALCAERKITKSGARYRATAGPAGTGKMAA